MAYSIGQYFQQGRKIYSDSENPYGTLMNNYYWCEVTPLTTIGDIPDHYYDNTLVLENADTFDLNTTYFFHGFIKNDEKNECTYFIKLINTDTGKGEKGQKRVNTSEQFISSVTTEVKSNGWTEIKIIFRPLESYNALTFQKSNRNLIDINKTDMIFQEFSIIKTPLANKRYTQIGVQSRNSNLNMVINKENIHMNNSCIYELKDDLIKITFFSVVVEMIPFKINEFGKEIELSKDEIFEKQKTTGNVFKPDSFKREIPEFTLDYIEGGN